MSDPLLTNIESAEPSQVEKTGVGPIVSTVVVVILIVIGGVYMFAHQAAKLHHEQAEAGF